MYVYSPIVAHFFNLPLPPSSPLPLNATIHATYLRTYIRAAKPCGCHICCRAVPCRLRPKNHPWSSLGTGREQGDGVYIDKNSNRYEGQWRNDRAEGYGIKVFAKGDKHEGYYSNDKRNGFGTYYWANGCVASCCVASRCGCGCACLLSVGLSFVAFSQAAPPSERGWKRSSLCVYVV